MQGVKLHKICVGSFIIWLRLNWEFAILISDHSKNVILFWYQLFILALKSPNTAIRNGLLFTVCSKWNEQSLKEILEFIICLARRPIKTDFAANLNLKINTLLKIRYVYDFEKQRTFVVKACTSAFCIWVMIRPSQIITGYL